MTVVGNSVSTRLSFRLLGPLEAAVDGQDVHLGGRRQRTVVAALLLARGEVVPTDRLIETLWPQEPPRSAAGSLQAYVSHLRRLLEPERTARAASTVLVNRGSGYALRAPDDAVDAWRFTDLVNRSASLGDPAERVATLREGLAVWRGPAMVEYADQQWALAEARRLTQLRNLAREQLLSARLDCGETGIVIPEIEALLAEEPLREEPWRLHRVGLSPPRRDRARRPAASTRPGLTGFVRLTTCRETRLGTGLKPAPSRLQARSPTVGSPTDLA